MKIDIPDNVRFFIRTVIKEGSLAGNKIKVSLCFKHTVQLSLANREIETELTYKNDYFFCEICSGDYKP